MPRKPLILHSVYGLYVPVKDRLKSTEFYRDVLGFAPQKGPDGQVKLALNRFYLMLDDVNEPFTPIKIVLEVAPFQFKDILEALKDRGCEAEGPIDRGNRQVLRFSDPDGHILEISAFCTKVELEHSYSPVEAVRPKGRHSPNKWEKFYAQTPVCRMPWYSEALDEELEFYLHRFAPLPGSMLELGCGAGIQAARLAAIGYEVVGVDIAPDAIRYARDTFGSLNPRLKFEVQDVVEDFQHLGKFDYAFDRGCFHTLDPGVRPRYVENVAKVLGTGGVLFLKTFSKKEPGEWGPFRFDGDEVKEYFASGFSVLDQRETYFDGILRQKPKGIITVFKKKWA